MEYVTVQSVLFIKPHCVPIMAELLQKDILEDEELGMDQENRLDVEQMIELLEKHDFKKLKEELESVHPVDIVDALPRERRLDRQQGWSGRVYYDFKKAWFSRDGHYRS